MSFKNEISDKKNNNWFLNDLLGGKTLLTQNIYEGFSFTNNKQYLTKLEFDNKSRDILSKKKQMQRYIQPLKKKKINFILRILN